MYVLIWVEPSKDDSVKLIQWSLKPLVLPSAAVAKSTHHYLWYTTEGLDILYQDGVSLGDWMPVRSSGCKGCTLPMSMVVLQTKFDNDRDQAFLSHWEEVTQQRIDYKMLSKLDEGVPHPRRSEKCYHERFFIGSGTKRPFPFPTFKPPQESTNM